MTNWRPEDVHPGDTLIATDAVGQDHECRALTGQWTSEFPHFRNGRCHWRPGAVITVAFTTKDLDGISWPVEALRAAPTLADQRPMTGQE